MIKIINRLRKDEKGFTLVELLVVLAILGVLMALAVPRVMDNFGSAKTTACKANVKTLQTAVERVYAATGSYPSLSGLTPNYISQVPSCPVSTTAAYSIAANGTVSCSH